MPESSLGGQEDYRLTAVLQMVESISSIMYTDEAEITNGEPPASFSIQSVTVLSGGTFISGNPISCAMYYQKQRIELKAATEQAIRRAPTDVRGLTETLAQMAQIATAHPGNLVAAEKKRIEERDAREGEAADPSEVDGEAENNRFKPVVLFLDNAVLLQGGTRVEVGLFKIYLDRIDGWTWGGIS